MVVKISHITHFDNLDSILSQGCLWSDAKRIELGLINQNIGYRHIKQRRLVRPVSVIHCIGVKNQEMSDRVRLALEGQAHQPEIVVKPSWYC